MFVTNNYMVFMEYISYTVLRRTWCEPTFVFLKVFLFFFDPIWLPDHVADDIFIIMNSYGRRHTYGQNFVSIGPTISGTCFFSY